MTHFRSSWRLRSARERAAARVAAIAVGVASLACGGGGPAGGGSSADLGPRPVRSIEPGRTYDQHGVTLRVDSILVGALETDVHLTVQNRSEDWVETRALLGSRLIAAGQQMRAARVDALSAGSPGVVAAGQSASGRVRFPPLPAGSLGLRLEMPLKVGARALAAAFVVRLERGWRRP